MFHNKFFFFSYLRLEKSFIQFHTGVQKGKVYLVHADYTK